MFMMYAFCRSELTYTKLYKMCSNFGQSFVCILYTKCSYRECIQNVCIQNITHISANFCIQNVYKMFVYKIYTTFRQTFVYILYTKFSWHSSSDFVYKMYKKVCQNVVYILLKFCIHSVYISCIHLVQFLYTKYIHSFRVDVHSRHVNTKPLR